MNIQSTVRPLGSVSVQRAGQQEYAKAREEFVEARDDHYQKANKYDKWGGRAAMATGAATLGGVAYLTHLFAPGLEGYGAAFPAVLSGFAVGAAVAWGVGKMLENTETTQTMTEARSNFAEKRDAYRENLLTELNDEGVQAAHNPVWDRLKSNENLTADRVTAWDHYLLETTDELALLADGRQGEGWTRALAHAQDDPIAFSKELELVQENDGIRQALVQGHGG
jgi:hypothetical protein